MIETKHPGGKRGIAISPEMYEELANFIMHTLEKKDNINLISLLNYAEEEFGKRVNLNWLIYHVKLDLEAKGLIKTVSNKDHENLIRLRLTSIGIRKQRQFA